MFLCRLSVFLFFLCYGGHGVKDFLSILAISQAEWDVSKYFQAMLTKGKIRAMQMGAETGFLFKAVS